MTHVGTPYYMSPEQITNTQYDHKSDIWSFGCVIYEIACLWPPFEAKSQPELTKKIKSGDIPALPKEGNYSQRITELIFSMLKLDPWERPSSKDIRELPEVQKILKKKYDSQIERD